jgi:hypothetical protein
VLGADHPLTQAARENVEAAAENQPAPR